jgi:hypothetical protein
MAPKKSRCHHLIFCSAVRLRPVLIPAEEPCSESSRGSVRLSPASSAKAWLCSSAGVAQRTTSTCRVNAGTSTKTSHRGSEGQLKCAKHLSGGGKGLEATIAVSGLQLPREDQRTLGVSSLFQNLLLTFWHSHWNARFENARTPVRCVPKSTLIVRRDWLPPPVATNAAPAHPIGTVKSSGAAQYLLHARYAQRCPAPLPHPPEWYES